MPAYYDSLAAPLHPFSSYCKGSGRSLAMLRLLLATVIALILGGCSEKKDLPPIGEHIARPIDVAYHQASKHFVVLNSNLNSTHAGGSLLMVARDGSSKQAHAIPRLGRTLTLAGDLLLVTFDREADDDAEPRASLFELKAAGEGQAPSLNEKKSWPLGDCSPLNAVMREQSDYLALSCLNGKLYAGKLNRNDLSQSSLQLVRDFPANIRRRALYLDTRHELLYAFVTDLRSPLVVDAALTDEKTWDPTRGKRGELVDGANQVPDELEGTWDAALRLKERGSSYQFLVYDLRAAAAAQFPFKQLRDVYQSEMRWLYFHNPSVDKVTLKDNQRYYRTNFWQALPIMAPSADSAADTGFYLSHRGLMDPEKKDLANANAIVEVQVSDDRAAILNPEVPTHEVFTFKKPFGALEHQKFDESYINGFGLARFSDERRAFVINSFRDLVFFEKQHYALIVSDAQAQNAGAWSHRLETTDPNNSYFQLAVSDADAEGAVHVLTCSFFGDAIILFKLAWQDAFKLEKRIQ